MTFKIRSLNDFEVRHGGLLVTVAALCIGSPGLAICLIARRLLL